MSNKPTLGIFGPAKNDLTGVTKYLDVLETELDKRFQCVRINNESYEAPSRFDYALYNVGNNLFHQCAFKAMRKRPGITIIHEYNCLDYYLSDWNNLLPHERIYLLKRYSNYFKHTFGRHEEIMDYHAFSDGKDIYGADIEVESLFLNYVPIAVVHSQSTSSFLGKKYVGTQFHYLPFPVREVSLRDSVDSRQNLGIGKDIYLFGSFGFIGEYKRLESVIEAFLQLSTVKNNIGLLIVGGKQYELDMPQYPFIHYLGYVPTEQEFDSLLISVDCGIQLRFPCLGETSGSMMKLLAHSRPLITTDTPLLRSLEDYKNVWFVRPDKFEVQNLLIYMTRALDIRSKQLYLNRFRPSFVAEKLASLIENVK